MASESGPGATPGQRAVVSPKGAGRWEAGHPWIYRSDVVERPDLPAGAVAVTTHRGVALGWALWSPRSEIALRLLDRDPGAVINETWWRRRIGEAAARREPLAAESNAWRVVHGEADGCPSLICDRYDEYLVVQLLSAGVEAFRGDIVAALLRQLQPRGILARNDVGVRAKEGLTAGVERLHGEVPNEVEVREGTVRYLAAPWDGQKTGAFLDQRENRRLVGGLAHGNALDCFSYHGSFALHLAQGASRVTAVDASAAALARARVNAGLNGFDNIDTVEADVFQFLRDRVAAGARYDTIVLDPPAFAKTKTALPGALRGYREINLSGMRLLAPGGLLFTASCSFHLSRELFVRMLAEAAADSRRRIAVRAVTGQPVDHPEILTIPESGYLKGALLQALD
ncbi:MAG TPA: class I SAM-dependent rRNA methyltransferase [Gemmatimonadaceae bacterium]